MNPEIKARWLAALRSGEFKQGKNYLAKIMPDGSTEHCCLGVLCEIAVADGVIGKQPEPWAGSKWPESAQEAPLPSIVIRYGGPCSESTTELPLDVVAWAGLEGNSPSVSSPTCGHDVTNDDGCDCFDFGSLVEANDGTDLGFEGIANLIEEQL